VRSTLTVEPGGQVELSSQPAEDLGQLCTSLSSDLSEVQVALSGEGISLVGAGIHPDRAPRRVLRSPRYHAMEAFFDGGGEQAPGAGRTMMCNTASIQVNLETGSRSGTSPGREQRWTLAHQVSPVLAAVFANSPVALARPTGWRSTRLAVWKGIDTSRTASAHQRRGCVDDWTSFALDARVMMIRTGDDDFTALDRHLSFGQWLVEGHELGWPTVDDLAYHLTTLFPPVRPKGWLEFRSIDALPDPWWRAAVAVSTAVLDDPEAAEAAAAATASTAGCWDEAGRWGMAHRGLADAAQRLFPPAMEALGRLGADPATVSATEDFYERFVARRRCPADDVCREALGPPRSRHNRSTAHRPPLPTPVYGVVSTA
jgi:glutamate--cysteine ligase